MGKPAVKDATLEALTNLKTAKNRGFLTLPAIKKKVLDDHGFAGPKVFKVLKELVESDDGRVKQHEEGKLQFKLGKAS